MNRAVRLMMVAGMVLACAGIASAAGFALIEQSVSGLGNAFSGGAAASDDASTIYFNPAGMTNLKGSQATVGLHLIKPTAKFKNEGSTAFTGQALTGGNGGDSGALGAVPNIYYATELDSGVVVGVGVNVPFGLTTEYDEDWVGRYHAIKSALQTVNINPSVAYKFGDILSIGLGLNVQKLDAELSSAMDFGGILYAKGFAPVAAVQNMDGKLVLEGDSIAYGLNGGLLIEFTKDTTVGVAYRSGMTHHVEGTADFSGTPAAFAAAGMFTDGDVEATANLPATFSISAKHRLTPKLVVMADATHTNWSSFKELRFEFDDNTKDGVTTEAWEDAWRGSLGATYAASDDAVLRFGVAYDQTPIPSSYYRTPRIPGADRVWFTLGGGFKLSDTISLNAAYAHLIVKDPKMNKTIDMTDPDDENLFRGNLKGTYEASVDIASVQLNYQF